MNPQQDPGTGADALNSEERCAIAFRAALPDPDDPYNPNACIPIPGSRSFILRRPPVVLVHGVTSSPAVWDRNQEYEPGAKGRWEDYDSPSGAANPSPFRTRLYRVDYSTPPSGAQGLPENFPAVALKIEEAIQDYRAARDGVHPASRSFKGIRYAATRADVVAHSMGGLLTKWYIADTNLNAPVPRPGFPPGLDIDDPRFPYPHASGRWHYLRPDNWGAGSIRRFITLGTPFLGSSVNTAYANVFLPGSSPFDTSKNFEFARKHILSKPKYADLSKQLFPPNGVVDMKRYSYPTALSDLGPGSGALGVLANANYPTSHRQVRWYPIYGLAWPNVKSREEIFECQFPGWFTRNALSDHGLGPQNVYLHGTQSDLIVEAASARNWVPPSQMNAFAGEPAVDTTHSYLEECVRTNPAVVVPGEPDSQVIRDRILTLLGRTVASFNPNWSLD